MKWLFERVPAARLERLAIVLAVAVLGAQSEACRASLLDALSGLVL